MLCWYSRHHWEACSGNAGGRKTNSIESSRTHQWRLMQPLFLRRRPAQTAFFHHYVLKSYSLPRFRAVLTPLAATRATQRLPEDITSRDHKRWHLRIAELHGGSPSSIRRRTGLIGHDARLYKSEPSGLRRAGYAPAGRGGARAISTTPEFSSIENAAAPGSVSGLPAIAVRFSRYHLSIASAASPVVVGFQPGCSAVWSSGGGLYAAVTEQKIWVRRERTAPAYDRRGMAQPLTYCVCGQQSASLPHFGQRDRARLSPGWLARCCHR